MVAIVDGGRQRARSRWRLVAFAASARRTVVTSACSPPAGTAACEYLARSSAAPILVIAAPAASSRCSCIATLRATARGDSLGAEAIP